MSDHEDLLIIDKTLKGDTEAYSVIIRKYQNMVFKYVYSKFNSYEEAQDISQEIFIMSIEALASFRRESKFSTWLYSIMINYCKNYRKKKSRFNLVPLNYSKGGEETELQIPDERENPENEVVDGDSIRILKEEISKLPDDYKDILVLRDIDGLAYSEISEILGINLSNVKVRIHRGRELLKNRLYTRGLV